MINNNSIAYTIEYAICKIFNIELFNDDINYNKINNIKLNQNLYNKITEVLNKFIEKNDFFKIIKSLGYKNESLQFLLENNKNINIKMLKKQDGKLAPNNYLQTLEEWDKYWNIYNEYEGLQKYNGMRFEFIKNNITKYLDTAIDNLFSSNYLLVIYDCDKVYSIPKITLITKPKSFYNKIFIYNREYYIENWNEKKKRNNQFSTIIKLVSSNTTKDINIGEFEFNTISKNELNFRFYKKFFCYDFN